MATLTLIEQFGELRIARAEWIDDAGRTHRAEFDLSTEVVDGNGITVRRVFTAAKTPEQAAAHAIAAANDRAEEKRRREAPSICFREVAGAPVVVGPATMADLPGICPMAYGPRWAMESAAATFNR